MAKEQPVQNPDASKSPRPGPVSSQSGSNGRVSPQPPLLGWPISKAALHGRSASDAPKPVGSDCNLSETEMMKERFAKLLLGEDMSGSGNGVCTALAISNAITNLSATIFGQLWRLEPLPPEKKSMWKREMEWLICVSDQIVEFMPSWQNFADGSKLEVMSCRPRTDIFINLPALRKLDNLLLEILESFKDTEFWYVDQGIESEGSATLPKALQRQEEKWWLPVPRVPSGGLKEDSRRRLDHKRECVNQILKAVLAINTSVLADMEVPDSFLEALQKTGKACLGDMIYRYITSDRFSPERLLDCLDLSSEHVALEIANRIEAAIHVWRRRLVHGKPVANPNRSSWDMVKDMMVDGDKRELLADRAERLLLCLKQQYPGLTQTTLDTSKIQYNKDVGKSILESYSRVLESLAFNIVARIDDVLYIDDLTKSTDKLSSNGPTVSIVTHKKVSDSMRHSISSSTPRKASSFAPSPASSLVSSSKHDRTPFVSRDSGKPPRRGGTGVRRVLTTYLTGETKAKSNVNLALGSPRTISKRGGESPVAPRIDKENADPQKT